MSKLNFALLEQSVFSQNFSLAGKGPFMASNAKNISGGEGVVAWGTRPRPGGEI